MPRIGNLASSAEFRVRIAASCFVDSATHLMHGVSGCLERFCEEGISVDRLSGVEVVSANSGVELVSFFVVGANGSDARSSVVEPLVAEPQIALGSVARCQDRGSLCAGQHRELETHSGDGARCVGKARDAPADFQR